MSRKVLLVATVQSHIAQFHQPLIDMLKKKNYEVHICACNNLAEKNGLEIKNVDKVYDIPFSRSPFSLKNVSCYKKLKKIAKIEDYDIIHCNTPVGGVLSRLVFKKYRKKGLKIFYTAHGFHFYHNGPIMNWIIYYPIEKVFSHYTDALILINKADYELSRKKLFAKQTYYIPGVGINTDKFRNVTVNKKRKMEELGIPKNKVLILSVGELNENKNHEVVIRAISELKNDNIFYIICGNGPLADYLLNLANELHVENQIKLLGYRRDVAEIIKISDLFVLPSKREGLGIAALEAMACGLPIITSNCGGIKDYSCEGKTGYLFNPCNHIELSSKIKLMLSNYKERQIFSKNNIEIANNYNINHVIAILKDIYDE